MIVVKEKCNGCAVCLDYCPMGAIAMADGCAVVDQDLCVECSSCLRVVRCPGKAFKSLPLSWPRSVRAVLSNPISEVKETRLAGRGTEEMKTNELTGRFQPGEVGFGIDVGRPATGAYLRDVEKIIKAVWPLGIYLEPKNPVTAFIANRETGDFHPELRNERVLTAVIEFKTGLEKTTQVLDRLKAVSPELDSAFVLSVIALCGDTADNLRAMLEQYGAGVRPNGKTNLGFGRKSS